ncbi:gp19.5 family protein [Pseudomonas asplenii]|uniref:gp19.5 family protein n=1 Tax=Pseudomonas asplenii TaxID=53407 RepID=UPI003CCAA14D
MLASITTYTGMAQEQLGMKTAIAILRTLLTHRVTYRFLALLVVSLGAVQGGPLVEAFGDVMCLLLGGCDG